MTDAKTNLLVISNIVIISILVFFLIILVVRYLSESEKANLILKHYQSSLVTLMFFYIALTTNETLVKIIALTLIPIISVTATSFIIQVGQSGIEIIKKKLAKGSEVNESDAQSERLPT